jgi:N-6 DNA Methylase
VLGHLRLRGTNAHHHVPSLGVRIVNMAAQRLGAEEAEQLGGRVTLVQDLDTLGFLGDPGLVLLSDELPDGPRGFYGRDLRDRVGLDAVFFRDGVPIVGFADLTSPAANIDDLRKRLWNYGRLPVMVGSEPDEVVLYNALDLPDERSPLARISRAQLSSVVEFGRSQVVSGQLFAQRDHELRRSRRAEEALLQNLRHLRGQTRASNRQAVDALVGASLLASYLADRAILNEDHLRDMGGEGTLIDTFEAGKQSVAAFFRKLARRFNGDVFQTVVESLPRITEPDISRVSRLLQGDDLVSGQMALWPYDFSVLPADLVSSIYEQLLDETRSSDAAFYTPHVLVDVVLDEVLPWSAAGQTTSVLDPACGSGAFLTTAFRRLAYRQFGSSRAAPYSQLRELLVDSIFGIDSNSNAVRVAAFGLYLGLLEEVDPPTVWESVVLPKLVGRNLISADAFDAHRLRKRKFDVVVGNPPWARSRAPSVDQFLRETGRTVADNQIASAFLWLAETLVKPGGRIGMVLPAKNLLHNRSAGAVRERVSLAENLDFLVVIDLSPLRHQLFQDATAPAAILIASKPERVRRGQGVNERARPSTITHISVFPSADQAPSSGLLVNPEQITDVGAAAATASPRIWRTLLWGSSKDVEFVDYLGTTHVALDNIIEQRGWFAGQGYQRGQSAFGDSSALVGLPDIDPRTIGVFSESGQHREFSEKLLRRPRNPALYSAPHVIFSRTIRGGRILGALFDYDAVHGPGTIGISCPAGDRDLLTFVLAASVSTLGRYWQFMTSSQWGVERDALEKADFVSLPVPSFGDKELSKIARSLNLGDQSIEAIDSVVFDAYKLDDAARERVSDTLNSSLSQFYRSRSAATPTVSEATLERYARTIAKVLNSIMPELPIQTATIIGGPFATASISLGRTSGHVHEQGSHLRGSTAITPRGDAAPPSVWSSGFAARPSGMLVDEDTFYVTKGTDSSRWTINAALRDADRIVESLLQG